MNPILYDLINVLLDKEQMVTCDYSAPDGIHSGALKAIRELDNGQFFALTIFNVFGVGHTYHTISADVLEHGSLKKQGGSWHVTLRFKDNK